MPSKSEGGVKHDAWGWSARLPADKARMGARGEGHRGVLFGCFFCLFLKASLKCNFRAIKLTLFSVEFGSYQRPCRVL